MGMKHKIHHGLDLDLAKRAIGEAMKAYSARFSEFNPTFGWTTETKGEVGFRAKGVKVQGEIEIVGPEITVDLEVPFILRVFKGKAIKVIEEEVKMWVEKARNGELQAMTAKIHCSHHGQNNKKQATTPPVICSMDK